MVLLFFYYLETENNIYFAMELFPVLYSENPFEEALTFRIEGASNKDVKALYQLFVKNLVAFVYYKTNYHYNHLFYEFENQEHLIEQDELYERFFKGMLLTQIEYQIAISPILSFCAHEATCYHALSTEDCNAYMGFIDTHKAVFRRIDALVDTSSKMSRGEEFMEYLHSNHFVYPYLNIVQLGSVLEDFFMNVCKMLSCSYLAYFDERDFFTANLTKEFLQVRLAMKLDLLEDQNQLELVRYSYKWLTYLFNDFGMTYDIKDALMPAATPFLFEAVMEQFAAYFSFNKTLVAASKDFPKYIFSSYEGYLLFDTLAKGLYAKVAISYVYRFLFEKGLIVVKDTPFREWYNAQDYPIHLTSATETLQKSRSTDREQFVTIIANLLDVTL